MTEIGITVISLFISFIDVKTLKIPDKLLALLLFLLVVRNICVDYHALLPNFFSAAVVFLLFLGIYKLSKNGLGFGDVKFAGILGYFLGAFNAVLACLAASLFGISFLLAAAAVSGKKVYLRNAKIPFAPFMTAGMLLVLLAEKWIV